MPTDLTEVSQWDAAVPVPDNGDAVNGPGLVNMSQPMANRLQFLRTLLNGGDLIVDLQRVIQAGGATHQDITGALTDITGLSVTTPALQIGDWMVAWCSLGGLLNLDPPTATRQFVCTLERSSASDAQDVMGPDAATFRENIAINVIGDAQSMMLFAAEQASFAEAYTIKARAGVGGGAGNVRIVKEITFYTAVIRAPAIP
jgi:hypothetical protein